MLDPAARRLIVAAALRLHVARTIGTGPLDPDLADDDLAAVADRLRPLDDALARDRGLSFDPDYPGDGTVETVHGGPRLVLACRAAYAGEATGRVVTVLIPGRPPQVTALPGP